MKSSLLTYGNSLLVTSALFLAGASTTYARNLRRSSSSSDNASIAVVNGMFEAVSLEDDGYEVVGGPQSDESNHTAYQWHRSMLQDMEEDDAAPKAYIRNDELSFVDPEDSEHNRIERNCGPQQMLWTFRFKTDQYGYETSWYLQKFVSREWTNMNFGPPVDANYHDDTVYTGAFCLDGDQLYKFALVDARGDGMCCDYGLGWYSYQVDGITEYDSERTRSYSSKAEHTFYVGLHPPANNGNGNSGANANSLVFSGRSSSCGSNEQQIGIQIKTDRYGAENSWELRHISSDDIISQTNVGDFRASTQYGLTGICVPHGRYQFTLFDGAGDGICCGQQGDGWYKLFMDGELMVNGLYYAFGRSRSHIINVGYHTELSENMSQREVQYLNAHNWRRKKYHERFGASYVPLKYDISLALDAKSWATELLNDCNVNGIEHEPGVEQGENLAKNTGSARGSYALEYPVENICRRWFEREETWGFPDNAHLTQGLWRSSLYMGCAESSKTMDNGGICHIQVCRYARAGNCNMGYYQATDGDNWKTPMLSEGSKCGPICPPNGCH